jgi:hypothetical protein
MRSNAQRLAKNEVFQMLSAEQQHQLCMDYMIKNYGATGNKMEQDVVQQHWISIGHQNREKVTFKHMQKDSRWSWITNKHGTEESKVRISHYQTYDGKKFTKKELELE